MRWLLLVLCFVWSAYCVPQEITEGNYESAGDGTLERQLGAYTTMAVLGYSAAIVGGVLIVSGIHSIVENQVEVSPQIGGVSFQGDEQDDLIGPLQLIIGVPVMIGCFIIGSVGAKKAVKAKRMLENVSLSFGAGGDFLCIRLTASF